MASSNVSYYNAGLVLEDFLNMPSQPTSVFDDIDQEEYLAMGSSQKSFNFEGALSRPASVTHHQVVDVDDGVFSALSQNGCLNCVDEDLCPECMHILLDDFKDCPDLTNDSSAVSSESASASISRTTSGSNLVSSAGISSPSVVSGTTCKRSKRITGGYPCTQTGCRKTFDRQSDLNHHARRHQDTADRAHGCENCEKRFHYPKDLRRHQKRLHPTPAESESSAPRAQLRPGSPLSSTQATRPAVRRKRAAGGPRALATELQISPRVTEFLVTMPDVDMDLPLPDIGRPAGPPTKETAQRWLGAIRNLLLHAANYALPPDTESALELIARQLDGLRFDDV